MGVEAMTLLLELTAEFAEVVDLSVEDDPHRAIFVEYRLASARQVNDAQAAHAEAGALLDEHTFIVGPAMDERLTHPANDVVVNPAVIACADDSCNSAHICQLLRTSLSVSMETDCAGA